MTTGVDKVVVGGGWCMVGGMTIHEIHTEINAEAGPTQAALYRSETIEGLRVTGKHPTADVSAIRFGDGDIWIVVDTWVFGPESELEESAGLKLSPDQAIELARALLDAVSAVRADG